MSKLRKSRHCNINQMPSWGLAGLQRTGWVLQAMVLRRTNISRETLPWYLQLQRFNNFIWGLNDQMLQLKLCPENNCEAQARVRQGKARKGKYGERWTTLKPKPLPRAYIKVGCHPPPPPPPTTTTTHKFNFTQLMARWDSGGLGGGKGRCVGSLWVTLGSL